MIKILIEENNQKLSKILSFNEIQLLKEINIYENMLLSEAKTKIMKYLIKKYNLIVLSDIKDERIYLENNDKEIFEIYQKIDSKL